MKSKKTINTILADIKELKNKKKRAYKVWLILVSHSEYAHCTNPSNHRCE